MSKTMKSSFRTKYNKAKINKILNNYKKKYQKTLMTIRVRLR